MLEKIITSKTRIKLLTLYLTNIDARYYLRELERKLDESLSPLRRQLLKLEKMGILTAEYEANLKYYRLNKKFEGMEELRIIVLGKIASETKPVMQTFVETVQEAASDPGSDLARPRVGGGKYDIAVLTVVAMFVLATAAFMVYTNSVNMKQVAGLVSGKSEIETKIAEPTRPDEMVSRRWKVLPGNYPALSSGETGGRRSEEL